MLLAFLLLPVALQQLGSPLLELVDRDHPARGVVRLLTFGEIASQPCLYSFDGPLLSPPHPIQGRRNFVVTSTRFEAMSAYAIESTSAEASTLHTTMHA